MIPIACRAPNTNPTHSRSVVTKFDSRSNEKSKNETPSNTFCTMLCNRDVHHQGRAAIKRITRLSLRGANKKTRRCIDNAFSIRRQATVI